MAGVLAKLMHQKNCEIDASINEKRGHGREQGGSYGRVLEGGKGREK